MKLDRKQIAAGLALAGMSQNELAAASGLEVEVLNRILKGELQPRPESLDRMQIALEARQVEFGPRSGVALKDDYVRKIQGDDCYIRLLEDIFRVMFGRSDDVLFYMVDPSISTPEVKNAKNRLVDAGITCRYLCAENPKVLDAPVEFYRAVPKNYFVNEIQIVYSSYVATNSSTPVDNFIILNSPSVAAAERGKFEFIWDHCEPPKLP